MPLKGLGTKDADLILEIVDAANENHAGHLETVARTFESIGVSQIPVVQVFNKCDQTSFAHPEADNDRIFISARQEDDIQFLQEEIVNHLYGKEVTATLELPFEKMHQLYLIQKHARILEETPTDEGMRLTIRYREKNFRKLAGIFQKS